MVIEASNVPIQITSLPDSNLINSITAHLKSQGTFDQFRKECLADVDTKPAYQNLHQRVESTVTNFLRKQTWKPDLNKNQLRDIVRKHINDSGFLKSGIDRIIDQVVNPKIYSVFLPKVEDVVHHYLHMNQTVASDSFASYSMIGEKSDVAESKLKNDVAVEKLAIAEKSKGTNDSSIDKSLEKKYDKGVRIESNSNDNQKNKEASKHKVDDIKKHKGKERKKNDVEKSKPIHGKTENTEMKRNDDFSKTSKAISKNKDKGTSGLNIGKQHQKRRDQDGSVEKNKLDEFVAPEKERTKTKVHDDHGCYREKTHYDNRKPDKDGRGSDYKSTSFSSYALPAANVESKQPATKYAKKESSKNSGEKKEDVLKSSDHKDNRMLESLDSLNSEKGRIKDGFLTLKENANKLSGLVLESRKHDASKQVEEYIEADFHIAIQKSSSFMNSEAHCKVGCTGNIGPVSQKERLCNYKIPLWDEDKVQDVSDTVAVKLASPSNSSFYPEEVSDPWIQQVEYIIAKMKKSFNSLSKFLPDNDEEALSYLNGSWEKISTLLDTYDLVQQVSPFSAKEEGYFSKIMHWKDGSNKLKLLSFLNNVDDDASLSGLSVSSVDTADLSDFEDVVTLDMPITSSLCSSLEQLGMQICMPRFPTSKQPVSDFESNQSHKRKYSSEYYSNGVTKKCCLGQNKGIPSNNIIQMKSTSNGDSCQTENKANSSHSKCISSKTKDMFKQKYRSSYSGYNDLILHVNDNEVVDVEIEDDPDKYKKVRTICVDQCVLWKSYSNKKTEQDLLRTSKSNCGNRGGGDADNYLTSAGQLHHSHQNMYINANINPLVG